MRVTATIGRAIALPFLILIILAQATLAGDANLSPDGLAIQGHDPVAYFIQGKAVPGDAGLTATHDGAVYRFSSVDNKAAFEADPARYAPQYGGYCAYGAAQGYKAPVEPDKFTVLGGKLYLNYNAAVQSTWAKDPAGYIAKADAFWASQ